MTIRTILFMGVFILAGMASAKSVVEIGIEKSGPAAQVCENGKDQTASGDSEPCHVQIENAPASYGGRCCMSDYDCDVAGIGTSYCVKNFGCRLAGYRGACN